MIPVLAFPVTVARHRVPPAPPPITLSFHSLRSFPEFLLPSFQSLPHSFVFHIQSSSPPFYRFRTLAQKTGGTPPQLVIAIPTLRPLHWSRLGGRRPLLPPFNSFPCVSYAKTGGVHALVIPRSKNETSSASGLSSLAFGRWPPVAGRLFHSSIHPQRLFPRSRFVPARVTDRLKATDRGMARGNFGERLKRERELREVPLDEITLATRIGPRFLEALENEQWDKLPGGVFNRGFVRSIARYLGLDEEAFLAEYDLAYGAHAQLLMQKQAQKVEDRIPPTPAWI